MNDTQPPGAVRLSAILPNYNHGEFVEEAIRALAKQSLAPDEIIVVDDASTDDSLDVLNRLSTGYPTLRIITLKSNVGPILALNRGLAEARGDYVYFGAADDITLPGLFESMVDMLNQHAGAAFACCEGLVVDVDTKRRGHRPPVRPAYSAAYLSSLEVADKLRRIDNWILTGAALIRRQLMVDAGGFHPSLGAFADSYALRRLALLHGCCFTPHLGLEWRVRSGGVSRAMAADASSSLATLAAALSRMRADPAFPGWYLPVFERRWRFAVGRLAATAQPMNRPALMQVGARGPIGRGILKAASIVGGPVGRLLALGWLTMRERPTSLTGIAATWWARRHARPED